MRKTALTVMATLVMVLMLALSAGSAVAGWGWEDCPPVSGQGQVHLVNGNASSHIIGLTAPENANTNARTTNPGNK